MDSIRNVAKMSAIGAGIGAVGATAGSLYAGDDFKTALKKGAIVGAGAGLGVGLGGLKPAMGAMSGSFAQAKRAMGSGSAYYKANPFKRMMGYGKALGGDFLNRAGSSANAMYMGGAIGAVGGLGYAMLSSNKPVQKRRRE